MTIWNRLERVIKSYLRDDDKVFSNQRNGPGDPDLDAAYEELEGFLRGEKTEKQKTREDGYASGKKDGAPKDQGKAIPESLMADFAELGLSPGAGEEACKEAYKKLLKIHHPDRHAGHSENMKKATEKTSRINAAYDRIENWRRSQAGNR